MREELPNDDVQRGEYISSSEPSMGGTSQFALIHDLQIQLTIICKALFLSELSSWWSDSLSFLEDKRKEIIP